MGRGAGLTVLHLTRAGDPVGGDREECVKVTCQGRLSGLSEMLVFSRRMFCFFLIGGLLGSNLFSSELQYLGH